VEEPTGNLPLMSARATTSLEWTDLSEENIRKKLRNLKIGKSPGPDRIHPRVLNELSTVLSKPLQLIFTTSLRCNVLPKDWKKAEVCAIYKKGSKKCCTNYRPVSLTSVVCKVMEGWRAMKYSDT